MNRVFHNKYWKIFFRFLRYLRPHLGYMILGFLCLLISLGANIVQPLINKKIFDDVLRDGNLALLAKLGFLIIALLFVERIVVVLRGYVFAISRNKIFLTLRTQLHEKVQRLSWNFHNKQQTGYLMARINNDVGNIGGLLADKVVQAITDVIQLAAVGIILFYLNWKLAVFTIAIIPFFILYSYYLSKPIRKLGERVQETWANASAELEENLTGIRLIQASCAENHEASRFRERIRTALKANLDREKFGLITGNVGQIISSGAPLLVIWYGSYQIVGEKLTIGGLMAFYMYYLRAFGASRRLFLGMNFGIQDALVSLKRVFEILDTEPQIAERKQAIKLDTIKGSVKFQNVSFEYEPGQPVLKDVSLEVQPGMMVALVGPSGAGKTTLTQLISRFYDPVEGVIWIDGYNIRDLQLQSLRRQIGLVPQDIFLFNRTIRENIAYGLNGCVTDEKVVEAAVKANAHEFIVKWPEGYDTVVGQNGVTVSGGEKQRLAIAREILRDPRILILDEATSSLDSGSEALVREALEGVMRDRTTFVIAHRLSTVLKADKIVVLDKGKIVQEGTHEELLRTNGLYARLYEAQFRI